MAVVVASVLAAASASPAGASAGDLPRVRLIATGGTIANQAGTRLTAEALIELIPRLEDWVRAEAEQFSNLPSGALTLRHWLELSRRVNRVLREDPDLAGVVVSTGTDTLEEIAYFLHLTVRSTRPVVVVGAMRSPGTEGYDGAANLRQAFRVAASDASRGRGVLVVLNEEINSAREVSKTDAQRLHAFQSGRYGVLGIVDGDRIVYYRRLERRHTAESEFDVDAIDALPRVDVILGYQDAPADLIRAAVDLGARGLVIAGVGAGATSARQREGIRYARGKGVVVVTGSRTGAGRVASRPAPDDRLRALDRLGAEDLSPVKARILLMLALTGTNDAADIQRMFEEY